MGVSRSETKNVSGDLTLSTGVRAGGYNFDIRNEGYINFHFNIESRAAYVTNKTEIDTLIDEAVADVKSTAYSFLAGETTETSETVETSSEATEETTE
mgnify:CR=1 FL=1